ncbi:MAG: YigZ family protein [Anaerolineales bacterium]|nr:YigZ family protein [Anaerolineales bacterium]
MESYFVPASRYSLEFMVANSRFIATISPAFSVEEAKDFITQINNKYSDATHNVPAFIIGHGSSMIAHSSDNGEPSGTAGRPALSVLKGSGLGDTVLVITRYFGGTKLGTGGLVKAYSDSAREIIASVPKAKKTLVHYVSLECPYSLYEMIDRAILKHQGKIVTESFTDKVKLVYTISVNSYDELQEAIKELSSGKIQPLIDNSNQISLVLETDSRIK